MECYNDRDKKEEKIITLKAEL